MPLEFLILIPAYNEENRIGAVLENYSEYFHGVLPQRFRILVVLNGCRDRTREVVQQAKQKYSDIDYLEFSQPIGKGGALIEGLKYAGGAQYIGYVDADGATPPSALFELYQVCQNWDAVVGSRWLKGAQIKRLQSKRRRIASRCFHVIVQLLFGLQIKDTQCGAKVFRSSVIEKVQNDLLISDMAFDVNLLFALKRNNFKIKELPTEWSDQTGSSVNLFRTSLTMFLSIIRLRLIYSPFEPLLRKAPWIGDWLYKHLK